MRNQLSAFTFVMLGLILGLFWTGGCGGGSGGGALAVQQNQVFSTIHVSAQGGIVATPADDVTVVREVTFAPTALNDIVLQVIVDGTYDKTGSDSGTMYVELFDSNDRLVGFSGAGLTNPGTGVPFAISLYPTPGTYAGDIDYPSASYKIRYTVNTSGNTTFSGQITSTRFRVIALERVTLESPSNRITG